MTMQTVFCRIYFFKLAGILGYTWQQCSPLQTSWYGDNFAPQKHICPNIAKITDLYILHNIKLQKAFAIFWSVHASLCYCKVRKLFMCGGAPSEIQKA